MKIYTNDCKTHYRCIHQNDLHMLDSLTVNKTPCINDSNANLKNFFVSLMFLIQYFLIAFEHYTVNKYK